MSSLNAFTINSQLNAKKILQDFYNILMRNSTIHAGKISLLDTFFQNNPIIN